VIDIYVTHYVTSALDGINDILVDQLYEMVRHTTPMDQARICIVAWTNDPAHLDDLRARMPSGVQLVVNDRPGRPDLQPSMRNKVVDLARASGCEAFVLLHNDVRPAIGWFQHLVDDWRAAEKRWGRDSAIVTPRYTPYHLIEPHPEANVSAAFWNEMRTIRKQSVHTETSMAAWCDQHGFKFQHGRLRCPKKSEVTDDGHQLMMFIAGPHFFDVVGACDEGYRGFNFDDSDWGIRALQAGKKNLKSHGALIGHIEGFTFFAPKLVMTDPTDNAQVFIAKWGRAMFDEMESGELWRRLHREQRK